MPCHTHVATFLLLKVCLHAQIALREGGAPEAGTKQKPAVEVVDPSSELCGIWAYIKWENEGCSHRSAEESDAEYQVSIRVRFGLWCRDMCWISRH